MALIKNNKIIGAIFRNGIEIIKAYRGNTVVYEKKKGFVVSISSNSQSVLDGITLVEDLVNNKTTMTI